MGIGNFLNEAMSVTADKLNDFLFKCTYRINPKDFSRERKMGFKDTVLFMLNMAKKSLQLELNDFFEKVLKKDTTVSKQAYLESRQKIKHEVFIALIEEVNRLIYQEVEGGYEKWNGYRLSAIDGSVIEIPNTKELINYYGCIKNQNGEVARAQASCIFDVVNKIVIKCKIDKYGTSERDMAKDLIGQMLKDKKEKELILFDRGYPSAELMAFLFDNGIDFVMRAQRNFSNDVMNATKEDQTIQIRHNSKSYTVRVVRFLLESGQEEILLTSLLDKSLGKDDFKSLYFKRWTIEIKFDELKNRLEIENFTGTTKEMIEQDFYASIYLTNMLEIARQHNDDKLKQKNKDKNLKHNNGQKMQVT